MCVLCLFVFFVCLCVCVVFIRMCVVVLDPLPTFHAAKLHPLSAADVRSCALRCAMRKKFMKKFVGNS